MIKRRWVALPPFSCKKKIKRCFVLSVNYISSYVLHHYTFIRTYWNSIRLKVSLCVFKFCKNNQPVHSYLNSVALKQMCKHTLQVDGLLPFSVTGSNWEAFCEVFFSIFRCLTAKEKKHNQISINVHVGDASGIDFLFQPTPRKQQLPTSHDWHL